MAVRRLSSCVFAAVMAAVAVPAMSVAIGVILEAPTERRTFVFSPFPLSTEKDSFSRHELDAIAEKLVHDDPDKLRWSPLSAIFKPHHNILTGNYDVNVLISALESRNKKVVWHDRRNTASSIDLTADTLLGILLNIPVMRLSGLWRSRHWIAIRCIDGIWYNLDSHLAVPKPFQNLDGLTWFLNHVICQGGELLVILHE